VSFAKDPADSTPRGSDGSTPSANEEQECSFNELFKIGETSDADVGIFGCGEDEHCVEDSVSSLGGRCINLDVEHEQDFDETLAVESHHRLAGIPCTYSDGITEGVKTNHGNGMINVTDVGCGSCNSYKACYAFGL
jgi:hypothetical protein